MISIRHTALEAYALNTFGELLSKTNRPNHGTSVVVAGSSKSVPALNPLDELTLTG